MADPTATLPPGSYDSQVSTTIGVTILCLSIASTVVVLRTYTRGWIINQMGVDDYFAIASLLMAYGTGIAILCMTQFGLGRHVWMLQNPGVEIPLYLRSFYVSIVLYCAGLFTIKMTFLFQYYRVFGVQNLRKIFIAAIVVVGAWGISQVLIGIFICTPIRGFWDATVRAKCIPNYPQFYINAAGNIITDIAVLVMPFPLLKRLNLPKQQKLLLFGIFGLGFFTVAISVLRIKYLKLFEDFTWQNVETSAWSIGELCSGITCACLPTLRPFLKAHFPTLGTQLTDGYQDYGNDVETAATAARHKRAGSGDSSQPSMSEPSSSGAGPAYARSHIDSGDHDQSRRRARVALLVGSFVRPDTL
ncbi:hypothetical protein BR93DRAFT_946751 [Coniochaeta sp. PMI_546]|nr:hypothetical protein BR93DRAFT_946751 [Coniochaeta sp. PMI_546]